MSENALTFDDVGFVHDPFESIISKTDDKDILSYNLFGREDEIKKISAFIRRAVKSTEQHRLLLRGNYGTGKTHHLQKIKTDFLNGEFGDDVYAIYISNLGISFKHFYEKITAGISLEIPKLNAFIQALPPVEPEESVEKSYKMESLRTNILKNFYDIILKAQNEGVKGIFLLFDEAEDIVNSSDQEAIQYFVQSLLHFSNELQSHPLHVIMGFSSAALGKVTNITGDENDMGKLGEAFLQRYSKEFVILGHLKDEEAELMVLDRLNKARKTPRENDWYPIKKPIIGVVNRLVDGNPREVLAIMGKALSSALDAGEMEVCGDTLIQTLSQQHLSYFSKLPILDWKSLNTLINDIGDEDVSLKEEFERLVGRLVGENAELTEDDFVNFATPERLARPINGVRILHRLTKDGLTLYKIHPETLAVIFKEKRYESDAEFTIANEIADLYNNPTAYQSQLTRGLWDIVSAVGCWKAEFQGKVTFSNNNLGYRGKVNLNDGINTVSCLFVAYMGHEFPTTLYEEILEYLEKEKGTFAYILYNSPIPLQQSPKYRGLKNSVKGTAKGRILEYYVYTQSVSDIQTDAEKLMGLLKALGNPEHHDELTQTLDNDKVPIFQLLGLRDHLSGFAEKRIISYPNDETRKLLEFLAVNNTKSYSKGDLDSELQSSYYKSSELNKLQNLKYLMKDGKRWKIANLNNDPIWNAIYHVIRDKGLVSLTEIIEQLSVDYIFLTDPDETISWYISKILSPCGYIESISKPDDDYYQVVNLIGKYNNKRTECRNEWEQADNTLREAAPLQIPLDDINHALQKCKAEMVTLNKVLNPSPEHITTVEEIIKTIRTKHEDIKEAIRDKLKEYRAKFESLKGRYEALEKDLDASIQNGILSESEKLDSLSKIDERFESIKSIIKSLSSTDSKKLSKSDYQKLDQTYYEIDDALKSIQKMIHTRETSKGPCEKEAGIVSSLVENIQNLLDILSEKNYVDQIIIERFETEVTRFNNQYKDLFNSSQYAEALTLINQISSNLKPIQKTLNTKKGEYANYEGRIQNLKDTIPEDDVELRELLNVSENELRNWNFHDVSLNLNKIAEIQKVRNAPKSQDELFKEFMMSQDNQSLKTALNNYSLDEILKYIKVLYLKDEISDLDIVFN